MNLQGVVSNSFGVGATIRMYVNNQFQRRFVQCGEDYLGQDSYTELFGVGEATMVDSLVIQWPSGWSDTLYDLPVNEVITVVEGVTFDPEIVLSGTLCSNEINFLSVEGATISSYVWDNDSTDPVRAIEASGSYSVLVTNDFDLEKNLTIDVVLNESPNPQVNMTNVTCANGSDGMIELFNVSGVVVESVEWNEGLFEGEAIFGLEAGEYTFVMTDVNGCIDEDMVSITQPQPVQANLTFESPLCFGEFGTAAVNPTGGTGGFTTNWNGENPNALSAGVFEVVVTDDSGCSASESFEIIVPDQLGGTLTIEDANDGNNGTASIDVTGGTAPYSIQWSNADIGSEADGLGQGSYVVFVTDANGCSWSQTFSIIDLLVQEFDVDVELLTLGNGLFRATSVNIADGMVVFDAIGNVVFEDQTTRSTYDINLQGQPNGMYVVVIKCTRGLYKTFTIINY